jgi:copper(I)-binding protein
MKLKGIALLALLHSLIAAADSGLVVTEPWIREAPPGAGVLAAYMVISNQGADTATISAIDSPDFERIEVHRTLVENGVARMVAVESLQIAAAERLALEPGGIHLMLYHPKRPLREGDSVTFAIRQSAEVSIRINVPVVKMSAAEDNDAAHHHHHHH